MLEVFGFPAVAADEAGASRLGAHLQGWDAHHLTVFMPTSCGGTARRARRREVFHRLRIQQRINLLVQGFQVAGYLVEHAAVLGPELAGDVAAQPSDGGWYAAEHGLHDFDCGVDFHQ